jgi:hypothetical protein
MDLKLRRALNMVNKIGYDGTLQTAYITIIWDNDIKSVYTPRYQEMLRVAKDKLHNSYFIIGPIRNTYVVMNHLVFRTHNLDALFDATPLTTIHGSKVYHLLNTLVHELRHYKEKSLLGHSNESAEFEWEVIETIKRMELSPDYDSLITLLKELVV